MTKAVYWPHRLRSPMLFLTFLLLLSVTFQHQTLHRARPFSNHVSFSLSKWIISATKAFIFSNKGKLQVILFVCSVSCHCYKLSFNPVLFLSLMCDFLYEFNVLLFSLASVNPVFKGAVWIKLLLLLHTESGEEIRGTHIWVEMKGSHPWTAFWVYTVLLPTTSNEEEWKQLCKQSN